MFQYHLYSLLYTTHTYNHRIKTIEANNNDAIEAVSGTIAFGDSDKMDGVVGSDDYSLYASDSSNEDFSRKFRKPAVSNEPLCVGDVVEYIEPNFVRSQEHVRTGIIRSVKETPAPNKESYDRQEMFSVRLACNIYLPNTDQIRRIGIAKFSENGRDLTTTNQPNGVWRPIHKFRLTPGDLGPHVFRRATAGYRLEQAIASAQEYLKDNNVPADTFGNAWFPRRK